MKSLTNEINNGKNDWNAVLKKRIQVLNEEMNGESIVQSDKSPNAEIEGGHFSNRDEYLKTIGQNIRKLGGTEEFENYRKANETLISKAELALIKQVVETVKLTKSKHETVAKQISDVIDEFKIDKEEILNDINDNIELFNDRTRFAIDRTGMGLSTSNREIPKIYSADDFKNIEKSFVVSLLAELMKQNPNVKKLEEAERERLNVPNVVTGDENKKSVIGRFMTWLNNKPADKDLLVKYLNNILNGVKRLEIYDNIIAGFENRLRNLKPNKKVEFKGVIGDDKLQVDSLMDDLVADSVVSTKEAEPEVVKETLKHGAGKIAPKEVVKENVDSKHDKLNKKLNKINEGWEKYKNKPHTNKEKPNGFTFLIG